LVIDTGLLAVVAQNNAAVDAAEPTWQLLVAAELLQTLLQIQQHFCPSQDSQDKTVVLPRHTTAVS
jgi:hypothetical protein